MQKLSTEELQFIRRLEDRLKQVEQRYQEVVTDFFEPRMQMVAEQHLRVCGFKTYFFYGGYADAERKRLVLFPEYTDYSCVEAKIRLLRYQGKMDFVSVNHRDFLGAVMGLGLRREKIGDLIVTESGCDLFVEEEVVDYLLQSELRVKRVPLKGREISLQEFEPPKPVTKEIHITVASMRLDAVLANGFGISRTKAMELIQSGKVKVNYSEKMEKDYLCQEGDLLTCRGKGRFRIGELFGESRKGKQKINIWKYI